MRACIEDRQAIHESAYRYHESLRTGGHTVVGLNKYAEDDDGSVEILKVDPAVERGQVARLAAVRAARDKAQMHALLADVRAAARGTQNLLYPMKDALRAGATVGEVCGVLREEWGEYDKLRMKGIG